MYISLYLTLQDVQPEGRTRHSDVTGARLLLRLKQHYGAAGAGRVVMLMSLYNTQNQDMVKRLSSLVFTEEGHVPFRNKGLTPIEAKALSFCLQHTDTKIQWIE